MTLPKFKSTLRIKQHIKRALHINASKTILLTSSLETSDFNDNIPRFNYLHSTFLLRQDCHFKAKMIFDTIIIVIMTYTEHVLCF